VRGAETSKGRLFGAARAEEGENGRRPGRLLPTFKAFALLAVVAAIVFGLMQNGLYDDDILLLWLPVSTVILGLLFVAVLTRGFFEAVPREGWVLISLLAALVLVKGLSMAWTLSETETIKETLRSATYLAAFAAALAANAIVPRAGWALVATLAVLLAAFWEGPYRWMLLLMLIAAAVGASAFARRSPSDGEQVASLVDGLGVPLVALAGYGLLQKVYPNDYRVDSIDRYRVDSTIGYPNTTAVVLGMGSLLVLARMTALRNPLLRGLCAVILLGCLATLYLTLSRGGIGSFVVGLGVLFALGSGRLQMLANLLLVSIPGAWLWWRMQGLGALLDPNASMREKVADGLVLRNDLIVAFVAAFALQAAFGFLVSRYELTDVSRRYLRVAVGAGAVVAAVGLGALAVAGGVIGNANAEDNAAGRLVSLGIGFRADYWRVGWEAWMENPLTGTGAGTFQYTWLAERPGVQGVKQIHNLYLEQGTETGLFAFLALLAFVVILAGFVGRAAWRMPGGDGRLLLSGLAAAVAVYLVSSVVEWHWYLPASTLFFFVLAAAAVRLAASGDPRKADHTGDETG
jgi:O-antigen ligase